MGDIFDLLGSLGSSTLSASEAADVRRIIQSHRQVDDRPFPSGIPDLGPRKSDEQHAEVEKLRRRVAELEVAVGVLCDFLLQSRTIDGAALARQLARVKDEIARAHLDDDLHVVCAGCHRRVLREETVTRVTGTICAECNGTKRRSPAMKEVRVEGSGGYRDNPRVELVEESVACVKCSTEVARTKSFNSSRGPICAVCQADSEDV